MASFVQITPDPFARKFDEDVNQSRETRDSARSRAAKNDDGAASGRFDHVRRPMRGIVIKSDTYATIEVKNAKGEQLLLIDQGGLFYDQDSGIAFSKRYSNFLIQSLVEVREEKMQIVQTFGLPYIFLYGEQPRFVQVSGALLNTFDFQWKGEWWDNYDRFLRGTKCVQNKTRVSLSWDDIVAEGYIIKADCIEQSVNPYHVPFNFTLFLTNYKNVAGLGMYPLEVEGEYTIHKEDLDSLSGTLISTTAKIRQSNKLSLETSIANRSLIQRMRDSVVDTLDTIVHKLNDAARFLYGRQLVVPQGFLASAGALDRTTQISLASLGINPYSVEGQRKITLKGSLGGFKYNISGEAGERFQSATYGLPASKFNSDEYVSRELIKPTSPEQTEADRIRSDIQEAGLFEAEVKLRALYERNGVNTVPSSEDMKYLTKAGFGLVSLTAGIIFNKLGTRITKESKQNDGYEIDEKTGDLIPSQRQYPTVTTGLNMVSSILDGGDPLGLAVTLALDLSNLEDLIEF